MGRKSQDSDGEEKERDNRVYIGERSEKRGREEGSGVRQGERRGEGKQKEWDEEGEKRRGEEGGRQREQPTSAQFTDHWSW